MKYRIKPYDRVHDIWLLQKRVLGIFWVSKEAGPKVKVQKLADELNAQ